MKVKKTTTIPARTYEEVVKVVCDLCGTEGRPGDGDSTWAVPHGTSYDKENTEISMVSDGAVYPEGGSYVQTSYDVCCECFKSKLMPFFAQFGAKPTVEEVDV